MARILIRAEANVAAYGASYRKPNIEQGNVLNPHPESLKVSNLFNQQMIDVVPNVFLIS